MKEVLLNGQWELREESLPTGIQEASRIAGSTDRWISTPVPGDIHQGLLAVGWIKEPLLGLNSLDSHWTQDRSWWFRKAFETQKDWLAADVVELELNGLDSNAAIFLNDVHLGTHKNTFYPFVADIKKCLRPEGQNVLLVRLTAGVEDITDADVDSLAVRCCTEVGNGRPERGDHRRNFVRKPQYSFGWDWSPRVPTTAIAGDVKIRCLTRACIRDVHVCPEKQGKNVVLNATVSVDHLHDYLTAEGTLNLVITDQKGRKIKVADRVFLKAGKNYHTFKIPLKNPQYWWPNGMGEQHLYTVEASLTVGKDKTAYKPFQYGLRFVELDTKDKFAFIINGKKVFCKGANWIPADTIYARVTDEKYDQLVLEARKANFNMLRVWGGGLYEGDAFYNACDRYGIMLWHDFMLACAPYPDHLAWFREEVTREADYQTIRLRNHPSIVLWSGNNECMQGLVEWWQMKSQGGFILYNHLLPEIVQRNCPTIPYWNGSPYGGEVPNSPEVGDRHHWHDCMMNPEMIKRITPEEYDLCTAKFVSEYGYIGAPSKETVTTYLDGATFDRHGKVWQHHNNTFEKDTVDAGINKHYADPDKISLDEYFLYSGLTQGLMYGYSLESFRFRPECHGGLFWMYEDCWGEVGWTIIDYYLRRKISWYFVRRAFSPVRLILREKKGTVQVVMANDTQKAIRGNLEFGRTSLDGKTTKLSSKAFNCPPLERKCIATFKRDKADPTSNLWFARVKKNEDILPAIFRATDFRQLKLIKPSLTVKVSKQGKGQWAVTVSADAYAHAVCLHLPQGATPEDNYFDLLPGQSRTVSVACKETLTNQNVTVSTVG